MFSRSAAVCGFLSADRALDWSRGDRDFRRFDWEAGLRDAER